MEKLEKEQIQKEFDKVWIQVEEKRDEWQSLLDECYSDEPESEIGYDDWEDRIDYLEDKVYDCNSALEQLEVLANKYNLDFDGG